MHLLVDTDAEHQKTQGLLRILVMFEGRIVGETTPDKTTEEALGLLMLGVGIDEKVQS